ncbi:MAG: glutamine--fructose-6-phosphate transaminase (isomerizing) [Candidatus Aenigmarchaeota archaeon]|nr:glutamine--fructose-6-phosphate transaminase (isomerizing) [Candidatus Aenigmarchaeota archaeon]
MCGIIGLVSQNYFKSNDVIKMLKRLEYRGYDSFGIVTNSGLFEKKVGEVTSVTDNKCTQAIAHTRWATTGEVTKENAHPHSSCDGRIFIVHNGIINNYVELKEGLVAKGHIFRSETDSEVIAHFFEEELKTKPMPGAVERFFRVASGEFAVIIMIKGDSKLYAMKRGSPLSLGMLEDGNVISSDIYAFSGKTDKAVFFHEDEFAVVNEKGYEFYRFDGTSLEPVKKEITEVKWSSNEEGKKYDHYMIKEIYEQPEALERLYHSLKNGQKESAEKLKALMKSSKRIVFVASGTSYHATLLGVYFLNKSGVEAHTIIASEFRNFYLVDKDTLIIAVSQSGETMDVIEALHGMKARGAKIASLVNVPYSTIQRMSNVSVNIEAGQEICVAATKSFVNQVACLHYIASMFNGAEIADLPGDVRKVLSQENNIRDLAKSLVKSRDIYIIGRGFLYPVAREIALKLKEISYIHAEGMMGGELKHGTLALIEKGTPVIALINGRSEIVSNVMEVKARGGRIIAISNSGMAGELIRIDSDDEVSFSTAATVAGQLLTYYIAKEKNLPIDKPRNLSKTITVK